MGGEVLVPCPDDELFCFGEEACSARVYVVPTTAPIDFIFSFLFSGKFFWSIQGVPPATVLSYGQTSGLHTLDDGRHVHLALEFSRGHVIFERPLHTMDLRLQEHEDVLH